MGKKERNENNKKLFNANDTCVQEQGNDVLKIETNKPYKTAWSPFLFPPKGSGL